MAYTIDIESLPGMKRILAKSPGWLDEAVTTEEASRITGAPIATLVTMRSRGGGPRYLVPKGTRLVRYFRRDLYEWLLSGGLKKSTADTDEPDNEEPDRDR